MSTESQIEANRLNAQKSTGPRSAEGKACSAQNALKSGIDAKSEIIRGEDPAKLQELTEEYFETYAPATPAERTQLKMLVRGEWQLDRLARAEAHLWESNMDYVVKFNKASPLGDIFYNRHVTFQRLGRRVEIVQRSYKSALRELERLQAGREAAEAAIPEPATPLQPIENKTPIIEIGFVPSNPPADAPAARTVVVPAAPRPAPAAAYPAASPKIGFAAPKTGNFGVRTR